MPKKFGDLVTSDHVFMLKRGETPKAMNTIALVCRDRATKWTMAYPAADKSEKTTIQADKNLKGVKVSRYGIATVLENCTPLA